VTRLGDLPLLTEDQPGTGGGMVELSDFRVEEIAAYAPSGDGEHCMVLLEKTDLTTPVALRRVCEGLGVDPARAGYAGLKDRHGITRQWISVHDVDPTRVDPMRVRQLALPGIQVLQAERHRNKIKTGHLRGNRFQIVLRDTVADGVQRAGEVLRRLEHTGLPNYFGDQRFGRQGDNAQRGLALLRGELRVKDRFQRRLLVSALQSAMFNAVLARRIEQQAVMRLWGGEVLQKVERGGMFVNNPDEIEIDQRRLEARELCITGPICGPRMPLPAPGSQALEQEQQVFLEHGVTPQHFAAMGRIARGGRRPLTVLVAAAVVAQVAEGLQLSFSLPPGAYATVLLREVTKQAVQREVEAEDHSLIESD